MDWQSPHNLRVLIIIRESGAHIEHVYATTSPAERTWRSDDADSWPLPAPPKEPTR